MLLRALLIVALSGLASSAVADVPFIFSPAATAKASEVNADFAFLDARTTKVYWAKSPTYDADVTVTATATQWVANVSHPLTIASLTLPPGSYLVSGKLGYYKHNAIFGGLECVLGDPSGNGEYVAHGAECNGTVNLQLPITLTTTTTVTFACHLWAQDASGGLGIGHLWGGRIYAVSAASVTQQ